MYCKVYITIIIIALLIIPINISVDVTQASYEKNDYDEICYIYNFEKPILKKIKMQDQYYTRIEIKNLPFSNQYGKPILPEKPVKILLPQSRAVKKISVESTDANTITDKSLEKIEIGSMGQQFTLNKIKEDITNIKLYDENRYYPKEIFTNIGIQYKDGFPILYINLHPVQYLKSNNTIQYSKQIKITIETQSDNEKPVICNNEVKDEIANLVDNPEVIDTYQKKNTVLNMNENLQYDYVIITTEELKNPSDGYQYDFDDLIDFRENQGLRCTYKTVEEIQSGYSGIDLQEKIRNFIKDAHANWGTKWILIGGDVEKVPIRYLYDIDGIKKDEKKVASDLYYQCLDGTYNYDGDEHWGEEFDGINGGRIDLLAEVYIGRAPIDDKQDLSAFVEKTLSYENSEWDEDSYLQRVLSAGGTVWSGAGGYGAGYLERCIDYCTDYNQETYGIPSEHYTITQLYERDESWIDDDVINIIDNGVSIINHVGHGTSATAMKLSSFELSELNNTDNYCLFYTQACHSGQLEKQDECFAERWVNIPQKGGFAAIMNTGYGYGSTSDYDGADNRYAREFYDALFSPNEKISRIGKANQDSKEDNIWHITDNNMYHAYYDTTLFGDPYVAIKGAEEASAKFSWAPLYPNTQKITTFYDESVGWISYRKWDFGDDHISYEKNPNYVFASERVYEVTLTVMDSQGYSSTLTQSVEVKYQWDPIAKISPLNYNGVNFTIHFSAAESWDPDGQITRYRWDFDDDNISELCEPIHIYANEGTYQVSMLVEDNDGDVARAYSTIVLSQQYPPDTPDAPDGPTSTFSGKNSSFTVVTTDPEDDDIQYGWSWGDGVDVEWTDWYPSGQVCSINHEWYTVGNHKLKVKARDENYGESNWSEELTVIVADEKAPFLEVEKPKKGIYISNEKKIPFFASLVFGGIDVSVTASDASGIEKVLFYIDDMENPVAEVLSEPYMFSWNEKTFRRHTLKIVAEDKAGKQSSCELTIWKFF